MLKEESRNIELNRNLFTSCEEQFSSLCPDIVGIVEVEAAVLTDEQSEKLIDCMIDQRMVRE